MTDLFLKERLPVFVVITVFVLVAAIAALIAVPVFDRDEKTSGRITDIGPLNAGKTSTNQRATVGGNDGRRAIVDVADYPTCCVGSYVTLHRRQTWLGVRTSIWPEGCRG